MPRALAIETSGRIGSVALLDESGGIQERHVIIALDAKRDQIFTARFERVEQRWIEREPPHLDSLTAMMSRSARPLYLIGEGIPFHQQHIAKDDGIVITDQQAWRARASVLA